MSSSNILDNCYEVNYKCLFKQFVSNQREFVQYSSLQLMKTVTSFQVTKKLQLSHLYKDF